MSLKDHWQLNPQLAFLNHGSFGAAPRIVLEEQSRLRDMLEWDPIRFLAPERELEPKLDRVRQALAELVGADSDRLAFVRNATDGVNAVVRSLPLQRGDEIVVTNHGYNACNNAVRYVTQRVGAVTRVAQVPFPLRDPGEVVDAVESCLGPRTRLLLIDHVTSPSGLLFPVERLVRSAHQRGIRVMIDGAHAVGMVPLDLRRLDPDYYTANHHKWLCGPKVSGLLYVRPEYQSEVQPTIISHAYNRPRPGRSQFLASFDWMGTHDPTPLLALPTALQFLSTLREGGLLGHMQANRALALQGRDLLCKALGIDPPAPDEMIGSLASVPLNGCDVAAGEKLGQALYEADRIEVPIFAGIGERESPSLSSSPPLLRISMQAYNDLEQVERLAAALKRLLPIG